jgi:hypothetical protein
MKPGIPAIGPIRKASTVDKKVAPSGTVISSENLDQLRLALAAGEGRASQRCIEPSTLVALADESEARFDDLLIAKTERPGARMGYVVAGPGKSYPRSAQATEIEILRRTRGWYLIRVARVIVYPGQDARRWFRLSEKQKTAARERFEKKLQKV